MNTKMKNRSNKLGSPPHMPDLSSILTPEHFDGTNYPE